MAVAVMGGAEETEIVGFGAAAERERKDVIHLQRKRPVKPTLHRYT